MAQVDVKLRSRGEFETEVPELWTIRWTNLDQIIQENFWPSINKYCPEPDLVAEATQSCKLPEGLKDLFALPEPKVSEAEHDRESPIMKKTDEDLLEEYQAWCERSTPT